MKIEIDASPNFAPFSFMVTVENEQEARTWFHVFNNANLKKVFVRREGYWLSEYSDDLAPSFEPSREIKNAIRDRIEI